ncbi:class I SAM-dependent methyltransferase [Streptomyces ureilyticus]|uniref:Class I SAM-dependent methyltransferase n=1 Tax=Streptomyces ureilyticus TaxID=1775131 RepID=A0ABX0DJU7_9ACTN|nr:class I SAM-dependent methyltransferase [Streptomyces ureilyticus]NGO42133.1 class I SAM-dependent methyltransferase [Streptomyces ureilyticus]
MSEPDFIRSTRASYDSIAAEYADRFPDDLAHKPLDKALINGFAELVRSAGVGPVADVGCGTGHVTAYLSSLDTPVFGIDLSPKMVAMARQAYPELRFHVGSMTAIDLPDDVLGGIAALYSTIHVPDDQLPDVFTEFHRVLAPGGHLLLAFQAGDEHFELTERFGRTISLGYHWRRPENVTELIDKAGLVMHAQVIREPHENEKLPRAFLLARKPH